MLSCTSDHLRSEVHSFLTSRPDVRHADLAQYCNLSASSVQTFLTGVRPASALISAQLRRVLDMARAGDILQPGSRQTLTVTESHSPRPQTVRKAAFYATETVKRVGEVLDYCAKNCAIGVITADFGAGKSEAVRAWRREPGKPESLIFEFDEFTSANKVQTVLMMCEAVGLDTHFANQNAGTAFRALCAFLRENPCLLIFDQCEMARPRVCQVIRQIWDHTSDAGVGVVMLAAPIMLTKMMAGKMADMGALTSRVGIWAPLNGLGRAEMAAIVKSEGFDQIDDNAFALWYKATAGSMRRLMRSIDLLKAKHAGKPISEKTIIGIAGSLWGMNIDGGRAL